MTVVRSYGSARTLRRPRRCGTNVVAHCDSGTWVPKQFLNLGVGETGVVEVGRSVRSQVFGPKGRKACCVPGGEYHLVAPRGRLPNADPERCTTPEEAR